MKSRRQVIIESTAVQLTQYTSKGKTLVLDDITSNCKISEEAIYKLFDSKDSLFNEAYCFLVFDFKREIAPLKKNKENYLVAINTLISLINVLCHIIPQKKHSRQDNTLKNEIKKVVKLIAHQFIDENTVEFETNLETMIYLLCKQCKKYDYIGEFDIRDYEIFISTFSDMLYEKYNADIASEISV